MAAAQSCACRDEVRLGTFSLPIRDPDDNSTSAAKKSLADETEAQLLARLVDDKFKESYPLLSDNRLQLISGHQTPFEAKVDSVGWQAVLANRSALGTADLRWLPMRHAVICGENGTGFRTIGAKILWALVF